MKKKEAAIKHRIHQEVGREYYDVLKLELDNIEKKKIKVFLDWNYDLLDEINDELLIIIVKLEKVSRLLWNNEESI